jgi:hypothetical protein
VRDVVYRALLTDPPPEGEAASTAAITLRSRIARDDAPFTPAERALLDEWLARIEGHVPPG